MQLQFRSSAVTGLQLWLVAVTVATLMVVMMPGSAQAANVAGSGNDKAGMALFTGTKAFANGAPACISCHSAGSSIGSLGGGSLGPDLTKVWTDKSFLFMGGEDSWINSEGVPVMGPIFSKKKVTEEELQDLMAFFSVVADESAVSKSGTFVAGGIIGSIVMLVIFSIIWSGRYRSRNQGTAHDALWRNYGGKGGS